MSEEITYPIIWQPEVLPYSVEDCLAMLSDIKALRPDVRNVVHTWCLHWGFDKWDQDDIMHPYITGDWRKYDGLSSPVWRGRAKRTGRRLFPDCELSEHILAYHPVAICHDDDFRYQRGFMGSNWRFMRRCARCEFGRRRALAMYAAVSTFSYPIYLKRGLNGLMRSDR